MDRQLELDQLKSNSTTNSTQPAMMNNTLSNANSTQSTNFSFYNLNKPFGSMPRHPVSSYANQSFTPTINTPAAAMAAIHSSSSSSSTRGPPPAPIVGIAKRKGLIMLGMAATVGFIAAQCYRHLHAIPRAKRIREFYKELGVEVEEII